MHIFYNDFEENRCSSISFKRDYVLYVVCLLLDYCTNLKYRYLISNFIRVDIRYL